MKVSPHVPGGLLEPLNISAYITWVAILLALFHTRPDELDGRPTLWAAALLIGFLLAFIATRVPTWPSGDRRALGLLLLQAALALMLCVVWRHDTIAMILSVILVAEFALLLPVSGLIVGTVALNAAQWWIVDAIWRDEGPGIIVLVTTGFQVFAAVTAWYARRATEAATALRETNAHLLATRSLLEESARDHERLRLARELHDVAGHKLTALKLNLAILERDCALELRPTVDVSSKLAGELLDDLRQVVVHLRTYDGMDLRTALKEIIVPFPKPRIYLEVADDARPDGVAQAEGLLRAAQEALTNIARHANADNAWVRLWRDGSALRLHVSDDGRGASELRESNGLRGMRERLGALGGSLNVSRATAGGVAIDVTLPLN